MAAPAVDNGFLVIRITYFLICLMPEHQRWFFPKKSAKNKNWYLIASAQ